MVDRRTFSAALVAGAATGILSGTAVGATQRPPKARNVVLVHGLFADGSSWSGVIPRLQAAGLNVTSVQNPLDNFADAVASVQRVLDHQVGPTVLGGHSFSGMLVTEAGVHPSVSSLVYIAARAPDANENYTALAAKFPTPPASAGIVFNGDWGSLTETAFLQDFANGVPEAQAKVLYAVQGPFNRVLTTVNTSQAAWRSKPSFYAVSKQDRTINPDLERFMAKRMKAKTIELDSGHLSLVSHPDSVARLILEAAGYS
ncbi:alpha/beta fold hydrolase [Sphingomonas sp. M1-B02]|uniref:alpha/beta fold hydrolase n=1 Tax=Sphingomonas sp. M1-B02 TaxID=3114300 RepID=UPI00223FEE7C|nr:alpha/beta hydrolase [Sphingomonas sp. S6-11]UZK66309.1 alpha/beta hydrolase [Sphingomonas sp. S6-11]